MPVRLRFEFFGETQVDRTLAGVEHRADDARPAWDAIVDDFTQIEARQFGSEGGYGSGGWTPLSAGYARWKMAHYPGKTILRRTDQLFRSLVDGPAVRRIEPRAAWFGSDVDYGAYHQRGSRRLPRRRPVELPDEHRRSWVRILQRFIVTGEVER
jgi:phage gpG-like protein